MLPASSCRNGEQGQEQNSPNLAKAFQPSPAEGGEVGIGKVSPFITAPLSVPSVSSSSPRSNPRLPRHFQADLRPRPPLLSLLVPRALSLSGNFQQLRTPKWSRSLLADSIFKYFHLSFQGRGLLQMRRLPPEGRQRPPVQRE